MFEKRNEMAAAEALVHPLKSLTRAQFAALGGDAVAYMKPVSGAVLSAMIRDAEFDATTQYHLLMSADGTPLLITDTEEAVLDWLGDKTRGRGTLHWARPAREKKQDAKGPRHGAGLCLSGCLDHA